MSMALNNPSVSPGWLHGARFDLALIFGVLALGLLASGLSLSMPGLFMTMVYADLWLLGYHHVIATYTKLSGTADDRRRNFTLLYIALPAVLLLTFAAGYVFGVWVIVTLYFFWQWFHYARQSWGIAQRYRRAAGGMAWDDVRLSEVTLWSVPVWGVLGRCAQQPESFLGMPVWMPAVSLEFVNVVGWLTLALLLWWGFTRWQAWQRGQLAWGHTLYMLSHFTVFAIAYQMIDDVNMGWLLANVWHNSQYLVFVWIYNRQRFAGGVSPVAPRLSWLAQPGTVRALLYFASGVALAALIYLPLYYVAPIYQFNPLAQSSGGLATISAVLIVSMGLNFHHYIVDGIIWKRKREAAASAPAVQ